MHFDQLGWGGYMTLAGMGTVFLLLALLMGVLMLIGVFDKAAVRADQRKQLAAAAQPALDAVPATSVTASQETHVEPGMRIVHDGLTRDQLAAVALAVTIHARVRRAQAAPVMREHQPGSHLYASRWVSVGRGHQNSSWRRN